MLALCPVSMPTHEESVLSLLVLITNFQVQMCRTNCKNCAFV
jgi:hypothetical protein